MSVIASRKVTISLPEDLVVFADSKAAESGTTRSRVIGDLLAALRKQEQDALAREGYRFYSQEAEEFAMRSGPAVSEAWDDDGPSR